MAVRLYYFARTVHVVGGRLEGGEPLPFLCAQDAEEGAAVLSKLGFGAIAYQQLADPDFDVWEEPELLATFGEVDGRALLTEAA